MPFTRVKAVELANKYLEEAIEKKDYFDMQYKEEEYIVKKTIIRNPTYTDCRDITVHVFDLNNKNLAKLQTTIYAE